MWPRSLPWRLFAVNAVLLGTADAVLVLTPISVSASTTASEALLLVAGTTALLAINLVVVRRSTAPLLKLTESMDTIDLLEPGQRVAVRGQDREVGRLVRSFNVMLARLEDERRRSSTASLQSLERERLRVARELHDGVGQSLTAVLMLFDRLARGACTDIAGDARSGQELTRHALDEVGTIVERLRPDPIEELGLADALRSLVDRVARHANATLTADIDGAPPQLHPDVELAIYRVAQEAITNALRHADASCIALALQFDDEHAVTLTITDDGKGMAVGQRGEPGHGLRGMRERAVAVAARLTIQQASGGGTQVQLHVPAEERR